MPVPFAEQEKSKDMAFPKKTGTGRGDSCGERGEKAGFTSPPKAFTEDTLLSAMETAGNKEFEKDTEKKGLGTPATRAAILEKLVSSGYVERKGKQILPSAEGVTAIANIPDYLKSASMTAEWENELLRMERGETKPADFMQASVDCWNGCWQTSGRFRPYRNRLLMIRYLSGTARYAATPSVRADRTLLF